MKKMKASNSTIKSPSSSSSPSAKEDKRFKEAYSKALAKVLLENESKVNLSSAKAPAPSSEEIRSAYKDLCFDHPLLPNYNCLTLLGIDLILGHFQQTAVAEITTGGCCSDGCTKSTITMSAKTDTCHNLISAWKKIHSPLILEKHKKKNVTLALSDRFVQGLLMSLSQNSTASSTAAGTTTTTGGIPSSSSNANNPNDDYLDLYEEYLKQPLVQQSPLSSQMVESSTGQGCANLAFIIFIFFPLLSIQTILSNFDNETSKSCSNNKDDLISCIKSFLGTYNGPSKSEKTSIHDDDNERYTDQMVQSMMEMNMMPDDHDNDFDEEKKRDSPMKATTERVNHGNNMNEDDSMMEIFAEESDDDDYDYGDDRYAAAAATKTIDDDTEEIYDAFNLQQMTKSNVHLSLKDLVSRLNSLLNELTYSQLVSNMSNGIWNKWHVSQILIELTLSLFKSFPSEGDLNMNSHDTRCLLQNLSTQYIKPLMILRDRALDQRYNHDALDSYLILLHTLLRSKVNQVGEFASKNITEYFDGSNKNVKDQNLSPARAVGLSSLAALCSSNEIHGKEKNEMNSKIKKAILDNLDDIIDCIEYTRPKMKKNGNLSSSSGLLMKKEAVVKYKDTSSSSIKGEETSSSVPTWVRVTMSLVPILDFLTGINTQSNFNVDDDSRKISNKGTHDGLNVKDAQSILQSGLYRELLLLYSQTAPAQEVGIGTNDNLSNKERACIAIQSIAREKLLRSILVMSSQATSTLGKYAARVPDFTSSIYSESYYTQHLVDGTLWNALLCNIMQMSNSGGPQLRMKGSITLSAGQLKIRCISSTTQICQRVVDTLAEYQQNTKVGSDENGNSSNQDMSALHEYITFSNCLSQVEMLAKHWVVVVAKENEEGINDVRESISNILKTLTKVSVHINKQQKVIKKEDDKDDDGDSQKKKVKTSSKPQSDNTTFASIRKCSKFLLLTLDNVEIMTEGHNIGAAKFGGKRISSKTD
mmetsp:Transcript_9685/g.11292  ORF Transcript_9685/g.11292 Transcript_9685/m.11292 type:complete len:984 (-) Transcript_9685:93-3044(-)